MFTSTTIEKYFHTEKVESIVFMAIGVGGIVAAILFYFLIKTAAYKGAAIPLMLVGLMLFTVGYTIFKRTESDITRVTMQLKEEPVAIMQKELPRMETVMKNFQVLRYVEMALALIGLSLSLYFNKAQRNPFWSGFGIGLLVMAVIALTADYFAEKRGKVYLRSIKDSNLIASN